MAENHAGNGCRASNNRAGALSPVRSGSPPRSAHVRSAYVFERPKQPTPPMVPKGEPAFARGTPLVRGNAQSAYTVPAGSRSRASSPSSNVAPAALGNGTAVSEGANALRSLRPGTARHFRLGVEISQTTTTDGTVGSSSSSGVATNRPQSAFPAYRPGRTSSSSSSAYRTDTLLLSAAKTERTTGAFVVPAASVESGTRVVGKEGSRRERASTTSQGRSTGNAVGNGGDARLPDTHSYSLSAVLGAYEDRDGRTSNTSEDMAYALRARAAASEESEGECERQVFAHAVIAAAQATRIPPPQPATFPAQRRDDAAAGPRAVSSSSHLGDSLGGGEQPPAQAHTSQTTSGSSFLERREAKACAIAVNRSAEEGNADRSLRLVGGAVSLRSDATTGVSVAGITDHDHSLSTSTVTSGELGGNADTPSVLPQPTLVSVGRRAEKAQREHVQQKPQPQIQPQPVGCDPNIAFFTSSDDEDESPASRAAAIVPTAKEEAGAVTVTASATEAATTTTTTTTGNRAAPPRSTGVDAKSSATSVSLPVERADGRPPRAGNLTPSTPRSLLSPNNCKPSGEVFAATTVGAAGASLRATSSAAMLDCPLPELQLQSATFRSPLDIEDNDRMLAGFEALHGSGQILTPAIGQGVESETPLSLSSGQTSMRKGRNIEEVGVDMTCSVNSGGSATHSVVGGGGSGSGSGGEAKHSERRSLVRNGTDVGRVRTSSSGRRSFVWQDAVQNTQLGATSRASFTSVGDLTSAAGSVSMAFRPPFQPERGWILLFAYIRVRRFVHQWKKRHHAARGSSQLHDPVSAALTDLDSAEWTVAFDVDAFEVEHAYLGEGTLHISATHLYICVTSNLSTSLLIRLSDLVNVHPVEGGLVVMFLTRSTKHQNLLFHKSHAPSSSSNGEGPAASTHIRELTIVTSEAALVALHLLEHQSNCLRMYASTLSVGLRIKSRRTFQIVHFNDVYHLPPFKPAGAKGVIGGASRFHTLLAKIRETSNPLVLFSGDFMGPSLMSVVTKGKQMVDALNFLGVHFGCFGNHEFDYGLKCLKEVIHGYTAGKHIYPGSQTTWIMSNMEEADGSPLGGAQPHAICVWNGVRVGLLGLCENWLPQCAYLHSSEAKYLDIYEVGERKARQLRDQGAEVVLALTHNRYAIDKEVMARCPSIDYLLGGHDHFYKNDPRNHIVKSGQEFEFLTLMNVELPDPINDADEAPPAVVGPTTPPTVPAGGGVHPEHMRRLRVKLQCLPVTSEVPESSYMRGLIERYDAKLAEKLGKTIGRCAMPLDSTEETVRFKEGHLTNFILDVMEKEAGADFAVLGGAAIAGKEVKPAGYITIGDVFGWFPNETKIMVMRLTGATIKQVLDVMVREVPAEAPSFPHPSKSLGFTINVMRKPPIVEDIIIKGQPLNPEQKYVVAVEDFVGKGKAKYKMVAVDGEAVVGEEDAPQIVHWVLDFFQKRKGMDSAAAGAAAAAAAVAAGELPEAAAASAAAAADAASMRESTLKTVARVVSSATRIGVDSDPEKSQRFIRSLICELLQCDRSSVFLVDNEKSELHFVPDGAPAAIRFPKTVGLAGLCATSMERLNIPDVYEHPSFNKAVDLKTGYRTRSMLACPVLAEGDARCDAVVQAINKDPNVNGGVFDEIDEMVLNLLGDQVGVQLTNAAIYQRAKASGAAASVLVTMKILAADASLDLSSTLKSLINYGRDVIPSEVVRFYHLNRETQTLRFVDESLDEDEMEVEIALQPGTTAFEVVTNNEPKIVTDASRAPLVARVLDMNSLSYRRALLVPLRAPSGAVVGLGMWINKPLGAAYTTSDVDNAVYFCELAASTLKNAIRIEALRLGSNESVQCVTEEPLGRIKWKGGWATVRRFVKSYREASRQLHVQQLQSSGYSSANSGNSINVPTGSSFVASCNQQGPLGPGGLSAGAGGSGSPSGLRPAASMEMMMSIADPELLDLSANRMRVDDSSGRHPTTTHSALYQQLKNAGNRRGSANARRLSMLNPSQGTAADDSRTPRGRRVTAATLLPAGNSSSSSRHVVASAAASGPTIPTSTARAEDELLSGVATLRLEVGASAPPAVVVLVPSPANSNMTTSPRSLSVSPRPVANAVADTPAVDSDLSSLLTILPTITANN